MESCYARLKEDVLSFREKGQVVLLGDFKARVGKSVEVADVIGMFGEDTRNASGNRLISFLNEVELVVLHTTTGRKSVPSSCSLRYFEEYGPTPAGQSN